ncbi:3-oxoacyl-ACP reductase FabG [Evansella halocellulosilytica]|uniref:3-oxoacyl-ACP reductase FabG n=1 Tax=Evansella halocellulosilytica TaxID=2011013 RepID=UPI000BB77433|nr:3-oxoacyl-ACP reductase FabG [Evansella halocellulosilytica]
MRLKDKVAIVTGGAGGIGEQTAKTFGSEGAKVVIADFDEKNGQKAAKHLQESGVESLFVQVNVADHESVEAMVNKVIDTYGTIDILINNAGITRDAMLKKLTKEDWQQVIDVNLSGVFHCTQAVLPHMIEQGSGSIINTSSIVGVHGNVGQTNYAATKSGVIGMSKSWAKELGPKGIRVNAVAPGFVNTAMVDTIPDKIVNGIIDKVPLKRLGDPIDIANAYLFLASEEASYINGTILEVNGGLVI